MRTIEKTDPHIHSIFVETMRARGSIFTLDYLSLANTLDNLKLIGDLGMGKKKPSRLKKRMLERQREPPMYGSESLRQAYEKETRWVSKVQKRKE